MTESGTTLMPRPRRDPDAALEESADESLPESEHFRSILPRHSAFVTPKGRLGTR